MTKHTSIHLDCSTQVEVNAGRDGKVCLKLYGRDDRHNGLDVFLSVERLRILHSAIGDALFSWGAIDGPDGGSDRVDIVPAEAVVDASPILGLVLIDQEVS